MERRPGAIAMLAGGVLVLISTFLAWVDFRGFTASVYDGDFFGFTGILLLLISLAIIGIAAVQSFAPQVTLPEQVMGFSMNQTVLALAFAAFVYGFSLMARNSSGFGTILCWLGAAAAVVGAVLEDRAAATSSRAS